MYDFAWLQSKTGTEAMSVSSDGRVLWWDSRRLGEAREELPLAERGVPSGALSGAVSLDYSPTAGPTKCAAFPPAQTSPSDPALQHSHHGPRPRRYNGVLICQHGWWPS